MGADLSDVSRSSGNHSSLTSMLRSILAQSIKDALNAMDMYVLKAAKAFEALARGPKAKMLCSPHRPEPVQFGSYEPPTLPEWNAPAISCTTHVTSSQTSSKPSWLAKPVDGVDLDSFFEGSQASRSGDALRKGVVSALETLPAFTEPAPESTVHVGTVAQTPDTKVKIASITRPVEAMDLDVFFTEWGLSDKSEARKPKHAPHDSEHRGNSCASDVKDLDAFLETCLAGPQCTAA